MAHPSGSLRYPIPTVAALIQGPSARILLVRTTKWRGLWGIPGGKVQWGERLEDALRRETREEVGLELDAIRLLLVQEAILDPQFREPMHFLLLNYIASTATENVTPNEEIVDWAWVLPETALAYPMNSYTRVLLERYLQERHTAAE
ncbi:MAG: NUDIX domain-containing protein [Thermorudis peleae]|nr:NUDIX domain-containing protein [Thermorudis peleae]